MKKSLRLLSVFAILIVLLSTMLAGCQSDKSQDTSVMDEPEITEKVSALSEMKKQLKNDFSFTVSYKYHYFPFYGFSQEIKQHSGKDGSFSFVLERKQWNSSTEFGSIELAEYYYRYEEEDFACYMRYNQGEISRKTLTARDKMQMIDDRSLIIGRNALFPSYLEDFTEEVAGEKYTFRLPISEILEGDSYLKAFLNGVFSTMDFEGSEALDSLEILVSCTVEPDSYRPLEISYDFSELKPYVLPNGAASAEFALDTDLMYLTYTFNFDLPETAEEPDWFQNTK